MRGRDENRSRRPRQQYKSWSCTKSPLFSTSGLCRSLFLFNHPSLAEWCKKKKKKRHQVFYLMKRKDEPFWSALFQKVTTPKQLTRRGGSGAGGDLRWAVLRRRSHNLTDLEHFSKEPWGNVAKMRCLTPTDCYHVLQNVFFFSFFLQEEFIYLFVCFGSYSWRWLVLSWHRGLRCRLRRCIRTSRTALWWCLSVASVVLPSRISAGLQDKERRNVYRRELPAGNSDLETESSTDCWRVKPTDEGTNVSAAGWLLMQHLLSSQMSHFTKKITEFHRNRSTWVTPQITTGSHNVIFIT